MAWWSLIRKIWGGIGRVAANATLNQPIVTAFLPALVLVLLGSWGLPRILQRNSLKSEALRLRGQVELDAVKELHSLTRDFVTIRLAYDANAARCAKTVLPTDCMKDLTAALEEFARRWDERAGYFAVVLRAYLDHPDSSPEAQHLSSLREVVNDRIVYLFESSAGPACQLTQQNIDRLESELACFSSLLLENARRHSAGDSSTPREPVDCP